MMLTALYVGRLGGAHQIAEARALTKAALEAVTLPRHRQEQLGRLSRLAVREGVADAALEALAAMTVDPPDIESDTELRVSAALVATLARDGKSVLSLLGQRGGQIPIDEAKRGLATVLRANAHELLGDVIGAAEVLKELPHSSSLGKEREPYAALGLCSRSADLYGTLVAQVQGAKPAGLDGLFYTGVVITILGAVAATIAITLMIDDAPHPIADIVFPTLGGLLFLFLGPVMTLAGIDNARQDVYVRKHGIPRTARVLHIKDTGGRIGPIPVYLLTLEVAGETGPYQAALRKSLALPEANAIVGTELHIVAHPEKPTVILLDQ
ncbi:MAG: hypothetical protein H7066_17945 [Cytophagaceae bacterium]|nr:hypothetical protein [Gemmatimonadaceae bacterium]